MPYITVGTENSAPVDLYYEDRGAGRPVVLIHGFPLSGRAWERQERALIAAGHRVISYDRRGFGTSSQPSVGYDYDTFAADLNVLLNELDLRDVMLAGFGMGTGEVARYLAAYGSRRVSCAAMLAPVPPFLLKTSDNPHGIDHSVFEEFMADIIADRPAVMKAILDRFYNIDVLGGSRVSDQAWQSSFYSAIRAAPAAVLACVPACMEDFRADLAKIDVPVLLLQGDQDRVLPPEATGDRLPPLLRSSLHVRIAGGPHAISWTHADEVNQALLDFIR